MKKLTLAALIFVFLLPLTAWGAEFKAVKGDYYLDTSEVVGENFYVAGQSVNIYGLVQKDIFAAGGNVILSGNVNEDVTAVGGMVAVSNFVRDDVRVAGGAVSVSGMIGGELLAAGGQIDVSQSAEISKDVLLAGGNVDFSGTTSGTLTVYGKKVNIDGVISGNLKIWARQITIGPKAIIKGDFIYSSASEAVVVKGAQIFGKTDFNKIDYQPTARRAGMAVLGFMTAGWLLKLLMMIVAALAIFFVFKQGTLDVVKHAVSNFWKELLRGFVLFFIIPIAVIIAIVTVVGIIPALIVLTVYVLMLILGMVFGGLVTAGLISKWLFKGEHDFEWYVVILGVIIFEAVKLIPFVGWILGAAVFMVALGTLYGSLYVKFEPRKK